MSEHRRRNRTQETSQLLFVEGKDGPVFQRRISGQKGEALVKDGKAVRYDDEDGVCLGYLLAAPPEVPAPAPRKAVATLPQSEAVLSIAEMDLIAGSAMRGGENADGVDGGRPGRSSTAGMSESKRMGRVARGLVDVDRVELAFVKLAAFAV